MIRGGLLKTRRVRNMKHIRDILNERRTTLFTASAEKGSSEWSAFNTVAEDSSGMFRVATPQREMPRYSNVVPIKRYRNPYQLFPKRA